MRECVETMREASNRVKSKMMIQSRPQTKGDESHSGMSKLQVIGSNPIGITKKIIFILDHIDGNASNNSRENLRLICPNCDSQLDTYKSKNLQGMSN